MKVSKFIRKKNKILKKYTGVTLVPKKQIDDCFPRPLSMFTDATACPYCLIYSVEDIDDCNGCPMGKAGNICNIDDNNTYENFTDEFGQINGTHQPWFKDLEKLIKKFNKSHNF